MKGRIPLFSLLPVPLLFSVSIEGQGIRTRKKRWLMLPLLLFSLAPPVDLLAQDDRGGMVRYDEFSNVRNPFNPKPFRNNLAPPSAPIRFLLSEQGKNLVRLSNHPNLRGLLRRWGINVGSQLASTSVSVPRRSKSAGVNASCNQQTGTLFNLEPATGMAEIGFPVPQNETPVDFIPGRGNAGADLVVGGANDYRGFFDSLASGFASTAIPNGWGFSVTGYYVHTKEQGCSATFEGGLPHLTYVPTGENLFGGGDPVVAVDSNRGHVYASDLRFGLTVTGIGLFKTTAANMTNTAVCPDGTHLNDLNGNDTTASNCWPTKILLNSNINSFQFSEKPHMRPDERTSGVGAGDVYVSWTLFDFFAGTSVIQLAVCPSNFTSAADCSNPLTISGSDPSTQFSHLSVRPDGVLTITYVNVDFISQFPTQPFFVENFHIKYVSCRPNGAPNAPSCTAPSEIALEQQPLPIGGMLAAEAFRTSTYPTHDQRWNGSHFEEFVAWPRCKTSPYITLGPFVEFLGCSDADVVMTSSVTDSAGNPLGWTPIRPVNTSSNDQLFPWVNTDRSRNIVNIAYYNSESDPAQHRLQVFRSFVKPGDEDVSNTDNVVTLSPSETAADFFLNDFFLGDYIGMAGKGGTAYIHFTGNHFQGILNETQVGGQNNQLSRIRY